MNTLVTKVDKSKKIISDAIENFPEIAVSCSFGKDSMVVLDLCLRVKPSIKVFSVMTQFKPEETFFYKKRMELEWNLNIETFMSSVVVDKGLPMSDPNDCCGILKVEPTKRALKPLDAWITGLRRTEGRTRVGYEVIEEADKGDFIESCKGQRITKINPILDWTELDIWKYIAIREIPIHPWYALGYRSLGCAPCTHLADDEDTERAGRWQGTSKCGGECGIHSMHKVAL